MASLLGRAGRGRRPRDRRAPWKCAALWQRASTWVLLAKQALARRVDSTVLDLSADRFTRPLGSLVGKVVQEKQRLRRALEAERDDDPTARRQLIGSHTGAPTFRQNEAKVPPEGAETPSPGGTEFAYALNGGRSAYSNTGTRCTWRSAPDPQESGCAGGRREPRMSSRLRDHASQTREEPGEREEA